MKRAGAAERPNVSEGIRRAIAAAAATGFTSGAVGPEHGFAVGFGETKGILVIVSLSDCHPVMGKVWAASATYHPHLSVTEECNASCKRPTTEWPDRKLVAAAGLLCRTLACVGEGPVLCHSSNEILTAVRPIRRNEVMP